MQPLHFMTRLSDAVYLHRQHTTSTTTTTQNSPKLIILFGWVSAPDGPLAKYVHKYQSIFPEASILLVKARVAVMAQESIARHDIEAAIPVIREVLAPTPSSNETDKAPELLIHTFSNGGSRMLSALYDAYSQAASDGVLPLHCTIFDSGPAMSYSHWQIVRSIMAGVPKQPVIRGVIAPLIHLLSLIWVIRIYVLRLPDEMACWAALHNDSRLVRERHRIYIYSDVDPIISLADVETHASQAEAKGYAVQRELFRGSPHVSHARSDEERYWKIVRGCWSRL